MPKMGPYHIIIYYIQTHVNRLHQKNGSNKITVKTCKNHVRAYLWVCLKVRETSINSCWVPPLSRHPILRSSTTWITNMHMRICYENHWVYNCKLVNQYRLTSTNSETFTTLMQQQHLFLQSICMCLCDCVRNLSRLPRMKKKNRALRGRRCFGGNLSCHPIWQLGRDEVSRLARIGVEDAGLLWGTLDLTDLDPTSARVGRVGVINARYGKRKTHPTFPSDARISLGCRHQ